MSLVEFLLARIAEDEAAYDSGAEAEAESCRNDGMPDLTAEEVKAYWATVETAWTRWLAEIAAKRRIVELSESSEFDRFQRSALHEALSHLATVYADHPDYRDEWGP